MTHKLRLVAPLLALLCTGVFVSPNAYSDDAARAFAAGDFRKALEIWMLRAYEGDKEAQFNLAVLLSEGKGTDVDPHEAVFWYTQAAKQGHVHAQLNLGHAYLNGFGTEPDKARAVEWWRAAAENGYAVAQYNLGRAHYYGIGAKKDIRAAEKWFQLAAAQNEPQSKKFLEKMKVEIAAAPQTAKDEETSLQTQPAQTPSTTTAAVSQTTQTTAAVQRNETESSVAKVSEPNSGVDAMPKPTPVETPQVAQKPQAVGQPIGQNSSLARVKRRGATLYAGPNRFAPVLRTLSAKTLVEVKRSQVDWQLVKVPGGFPVWAQAGKFAVVGDQAIVKEKGARAYSAPGAAAGSVGLGEFRLNETLQIISSQPNWLQVQGSDSVSAWINQKDVETAEFSQAAVDEWDNQRTVVMETLRAKLLVQNRQTPTLTEGAGSLSSNQAQNQRQSQTTAGLTTSSADKSRNTGSNASPTLGQRTARLGNKSVKVYPAQNTGTEALIELLPKSLVIVTRESSGWLKVRVPGGLPVWVHSDFVKHDGKTGHIKGIDVRARSLPSTSVVATPVGYFNNGDEVIILQQKNDWLHVQAPERLTGWIRSRGVKNIGSQTRTLALEWEARRKRSLGIISAEQAKPQVSQVNRQITQPVPAATVSDTQPKANEQPVKRQVVEVDPKPKQVAAKTQMDTQTAVQATTQAVKTPNVKRQGIRIVQAKDQPLQSTSVTPLNTPAYSGGVRFNDHTWLYALPQDYYTIQLMSSRSETEAINYIQSRGLQRDARYFAASQGGNLWYYVLYGSYPSVGAAETGRDRLGLSPRSTMVRNLGVLQKKRCLKRNQLPTEYVSSLSNYCGSGALASTASAVATEQNTPARLADEPVEVVNLDQPEKSSIAWSVRRSGVKGGLRMNDDSWLFQQNGDNYTIELINTSSEDIAREYIRIKGLQKDAIYFKGTKNDNPWYSVVYGAFNSSDQAQVMIDELKLPLRATWVRQISEIQSDRCSGKDLLSGVEKTQLEQYCSGGAPEVVASADVTAQSVKVASAEQTGQTRSVSAASLQTQADAFLRNLKNGFNFNDNRWLYGQSPNGYTLQLISTPNEGRVWDYLKKNGIQQAGRYFSTNRNGERWFYIVTGQYETLAEAERERARWQGRADPWIRRFGVLQRNRCKAVSRLPAEESNNLSVYCSS